MKFPNAEKAFIDIEKLSGYCLNSIHERGKHKAHLLFSVLGLTADDAEEVKAAILQAVQECEAESGSEDQYGKRYAVDFKMTTKKGAAEVRSTWIIRGHEDFARLTSCYILKKGRTENE